jgi:3-hydroxyacyl-CoA dehydrogenase
MKINQVGILGSGVMGAQIAGVFANANIPTLLFGYQDFVYKDLDKINNFKPNALFCPDKKSWISPKSFEHDLEELLNCDLVIEAIIEDIDAKQALFKMVLPYLSDNVILATNTSSLSIDKIGVNLGSFQSRFCGIHFFNPPRYMSLVELIASKQTDGLVLDKLEDFFTSEIGKNILYAKDETGFIANRIGVFSIAACIYHAERLSIGFDTVDALTGTKLKRPKSATFRTADLVGLDILKHVFEQFYQTHENDPWRDYFKTPEWLNSFIKDGVLGEKTKGGIYKKEDGVLKAYQSKTQSYVRTNYDIDKSVKEILKENISKQLALLKANNSAQAQFLYSVIKDTCLYSSYHLKTIAHSVRDIDWSLHWGFGWEVGIFEYWQANGVEQSLALFLEDDKDIATANWLGDITNFYTDDGAYSPEEKTYIAYSNHSVYQRQLYRPNLVGEGSNEYGETIFENDSVRFFHEDDDITVFSLKTKLHTLNLEVINSLKKAIDIAEKDFKAMILWQDNAPFCAGANLYEIIAGAKLGMIEHENFLTKARQKAWSLLKPNLPSVESLIPIEEVIESLQQALMALKYSKIPTIAAIEGMAIGGGCEMILHCDKRVAHAESYIGLVEIGVGLLPAGGGCKEMARRAAKHDDIFPTLAKYFEQIGLAKVSTSAIQAVEMGYLDEDDLIIPQRLELLYFAKKQAKLMIDQHYRAEDPNKSFRVGGATAKANILAQLLNMQTGNFISAHDHLITKKIADVLCGGELDANTEVNSQYLLDLEKKHFIELLKIDKTQNRIEHMLIKHKPLRN